MKDVSLEIVPVAPPTDRVVAQATSADTVRGAINAHRAVDAAILLIVRLMIAGGKIQACKRAQSKLHGIVQTLTIGNNAKTKR